MKPFEEVTNRRPFEKMNEEILEKLDEAILEKMEGKMDEKMGQELGNMDEETLDEALLGSSVTTYHPQ